MENAQYFASLFEVGRRYKIMNPDKMRSEYGKLLWPGWDAEEGLLKALRDLGRRCHPHFGQVEFVLQLS